MATTSPASPGTERTWRDRLIGRARQIAVALLAPAVVLCIGVALTGAGEKVLVAESVQSIPAIDGRRDAIWDSATPVTIPFRGGTSDVPWVAMSALHDADRVYFLLEWPDAAETRDRSPWEFDGAGWTRIPPEVMYEDKAAMYWPINDSPSFDARGCTAACHYGGGQSGGYREKGGQVGLLSVGAHHMERQGELADEWHWKAARTDPFAQMDDGYLGGRPQRPQADRPTAEQEKGGRFSDEPAATAGGYKDNVIAEGGMPEFDFPPDWTGQRLLLMKTDATPIADQSAYAAGDRVPALVLAPLAGKRGDIEAKGIWQAGKWTVEIARDLSTGDPHDVDFADTDRSYPFGVVVFNNRQFEHSHNLGVYWLRFE